MRLLEAKSIKPVVAILVADDLLSRHVIDGVAQILRHDDHIACGIMDSPELTGVEDPGVVFEPCQRVSLCPVDNIGLPAIAIQDIYMPVHGLLAAGGPLMVIAEVENLRLRHDSLLDLLLFVLQGRFRVDSDARRAGIYVASREVAVSTPTVTAILTRSMLLMPWTALRITRVMTSASSMPTNSPTNVEAAP